MGGLHIHNWATGKSVHLVVYAGESISRFICHSGRFLAPQTTLSLFPTGSVHRVFSLTFHCFTGLDFIK